MFATTLIAPPALAGKGKKVDRAPLLENMREFFAADEWGVTRLEGDTVLRSDFRGNAGAWAVVTLTREEAEQVVVYSVLQSNVPEERRPALAEFIARANYGLYIGNFELDFSDGEVRFKTSIDVEGGKLEPTMIKNLVHTNVATMDRYYTGLQKVAWGGLDPSAAIGEIEE